MIFADLSYQGLSDYLLPGPSALLALLLPIPPDFAEVISLRKPQ
jgi:hypothetical protein